MFDTLGHPYFQLTYKLLRIVLHIVKYLGYGFAIDNLVNVIRTILFRDVYGIRVAKEIMHIAQYFLVGTYKEYTEVVGLVLT